jgi:hypothetical protein
MEFVKRMSVLGIVLLLLSAVGTAFAQSPCAILIVGQSLGQGVYGQRSGIAEVIDTDDFRMKSNCSSISFVDGATGSSAAECAITQQQEDPNRPTNCWINHSPDYNDGERYGNAFQEAQVQVDIAMNNLDPTKRKRIIALIWSQGEDDAAYITKKFSRIRLITEPEDLCTVQDVYCKAAYKNNVAEIFMVLRSMIVSYSRENFGVMIEEKDIPIFIPVIGRRAFRSNVSTASIMKSDKGIQTIREAQYEIVNEGVNVYIAALGYDQPLQAIEPHRNNQVHPTQAGYLETAKRLGFAIRSAFDHIPIYIGPKVVEASWDGMDIVATVAHSTQTSMPSARHCIAPTYCGFRVFDDATSLAIEVRKDDTPNIVNGLKHTRYRIKLLDQPNSSKIDLAFAFGAMHEINVLRTVNGVERNEAKNILKQKCLSTVSPAECGRPENRTLPIQPAFFSSQNGAFSNRLND